MRNKLKLGLTFLSPSLTLFGSTLVAVSLMSACSASKWHEVQGTPNTVSSIPEKQTAPINDRPSMTTPGRVDQPLPRNEDVNATDPDPHGADSSRPAVVVHTNPPPAAPPREQPKAPSDTNSLADRYFVIQNIATEKIRIYRNCESMSKGGECVHKLILEADMAAGKDSARGRSLLGSYTISKWFKFYEDQDHSYPSFFAENYPELPGADAPLSAWLAKTELPNGKGVTRGSFGWYTAYLEPNANDQWTHGTLGFGADGSKFIAAAKDPANAPLFTRSLGCTRVENQVIAFMRQYLPVGTKMIKVYAKEDLADQNLIRYESQGRVKWFWILSKSGTMSMTLKSGDRDFTGTNADVLDSGAYLLNQTPSVANGNLYKIPEASFKGTFLVDEGRLSAYEHPKELGVGGFEDHKLPDLVIER